MATRRVVVAPLLGQVREKLRRRAVHPVVRVRARHAVLAVLEGLATRHRRTAHGRHATALRGIAAAGLLLALLTPGVALTAATTPAAAAGKTTFTVGLVNDVDSFNPFLGIEAPSYEAWALTYDM